VEGYDPWYRDTNRAIVSAFRAACDRDAGCRAIEGDPIDRLESLLDRVRSHPIVGRARDVGVGGHMSWDRSTGAIAADLRLRGAVHARVRARWNDRSRHARAAVRLTGWPEVGLVVTAA
jgi:hypothetical protein